MGGTAGGVAQIGAGALGMVDAKNRADSLRQQAEYNARQAEYNAALIDYQKEDIEDQRDLAIARRYEQTRQILGSQKAALAAQGIDVEGDIGQTFEDQERKFAIDDVHTIKNNAWREVFGLEVEQQSLRSEAVFTRLSGESEASQTIATAGREMLGGTAKGLGTIRKYNPGPRLRRS